ncbi:hypothetical protein Tco_0476512, partial [Tanacetum coccineum]
TEENIKGTEEKVESTDGHKKGTEEEIAAQATHMSQAKAPKHPLKHPLLKYLEMMKQ